MVLFMYLKDLIFINVVRVVYLLTYILNTDGGYAYFTTVCMKHALFWR